MPTDVDPGAPNLPWCVVAAMHSELSAVKQLKLSHVQFLETGIGTANAERSIRAFFSKHAVSCVVHIGFAGALSTSLCLGDVAVAESITGIADCSVDPKLQCVVEALSPSGVTLRRARIVTADHILANSAEKKEFARRHAGESPACVDMESAPVARACAEHGVPYVALRCITDTLDEDLPIDFNECRGRDGNIHTMRIMWAAAHHPSSIAGLMEMRRRARDCARNLAEVVRCLHVAYRGCAGFSLGGSTHHTA
jgi:adenosylhomocysteine nucleosidase